ncbi:damage-inducible protein DinB [Peribacillus cavernae]|uniref:Damage-inducible protein DinB n=1 Tax=Peribacillus cavernae TaxID=1674310 RepID=A0A433HWM8_9BACI|nr:DinB family protein [Peribacillus cavernae]MDQ0218128.1 putative damage-inducible protein DinB [Peribacillus cavernae]RUQ32718.1 damage-inducible protein DinB [Peribacillus cavernae]
MNVSLQFFDYHLWANALVFKHVKELPADIYHQEVQSSFPSLYETFFHMYQVDHVWLSTLKKESFDKIAADVQHLKDKNQEKSIEVLEESFIQMGEKYNQFIQKLEDLHAKISIHHPSYGTLTTSYFELLQHVVNHGTYHRGNITSILRQLGYQGQPTDYVSYLYETKD